MKLEKRRERTGVVEERWGHERGRKSVQAEEAMLLAVTSCWQRLLWNSSKNISALYVWPGQVRVERERQTDSLALSPSVCLSDPDRIHAAHSSTAFSPHGSVYQPLCHCVWWDTCRFMSESWKCQLKCVRSSECQTGMCWNICTGCFVRLLHPQKLIFVFWPLGGGRNKLRIQH